jgi:type II secretory pathway component GspD/PulD (secretin)
MAQSKKIRPMKILNEKISDRLICTLGAILVVLVLVNSAAAQEVAVIKVQYRRAAELVAVVQSLLSDDGSVTVSQRVNSLVIVDSAEAIQRVYAYVERFDTPVEQVRIRVRFHGGHSGHQEAHAVRGRYARDDLRVDVGGRKKDRTRVFSRSQEYRRSGSTEAFVVAMSGSPAFIRTGKEIPYLSSSPFIRRHAPGGATVEWHSVESGFEVTPIIAGDNVILKIVPRIAYDERDNAVIRFFGARTELTVPFGQWVEIGGAGKEQNEIFREILAQRNSSGQTATSMSLMVESP